MMKEYMKLIREIAKMDDFEIISTSGHKNTLKVVYVSTSAIYSVHPGDKAVKPLKAWMNKQKKKL